MWLRQRKGYYGSTGLTRGPQNSGRLKRLKRSFDLTPTSLSTIKHTCTLLPYQCITLMCIAQFILQVISYRHNMSSISLILTKLTHVVPVKWSLRCNMILKRIDSTKRIFEKPHPGNCIKNCKMRSRFFCIPVIPKICSKTGSTLIWIFTIGFQAEWS